MGHKQYQISIERNGQMVPVGQINGENYETAQFAYSDQYLKDGRGRRYLRGRGTLEVEVPQRSRYPRGRDTPEVEVSLGARYPRGLEVWRSEVP